MAKTKKDSAEQEFDREATISKAYVALSKVKTVEQLREVWKEHYLIVGHRILGRLLLGQDVASAMRRKKE